MKRVVCIALLSLFAVTANAQTEEPDPLSFFPHSVGNKWIYLYHQSSVDSLVITNIQTDASNTYIFYNTHTEPSYIIDKNYDVYNSPLQSDLMFLYYRLTANKGDIWVVQKDTHSTGSNMCAVVLDVYKTFVFGRYTTVKEIAYYLVPKPDTTITENSAYVYTQLLASGFGFIRHIGEAGDVWTDLVGCIIDGDTLGTVTGVDEPVASPLPLQIYPNPCSSFTTIYCALPEGTTPVRLELTDVFGRTVYSTTVHDDTCTLDISALSTGIYFCRVRAGTQTRVQELIVRR